MTSIFNSIRRHISGNPTQTDSDSKVKSHTVDAIATDDVPVTSENVEENVTIIDVTEGDDKKEADDDKLKPLDGGYGWVIVFACFLAHILFGGFERNDGVFYLQLEHRYGESAQLIGWALGTVSSIRLMFGPVASTFSSRFSTRMSVMIGGSLQTLACVLTAYSPTFWFIYFSHTALQGFGRGFMYAPSLIIVGEYFDKRRGLAAGLGSSGVGVGTFAIVPLTQVLFDYYGFQGAFLILAGIAANSFVVAMLFRPLSLHYKFLKARALEEERRRTLHETEQNCMTATVSEEDYLQVEPAQVHTDLTQYVKASTENGVDTNEEKKENGVISNETKKEKKKENGCFKSSLAICCPVEKKPKDKKKRKLFQFHLIKDPSFLCFCISIALFSSAFKAAFTFLPALVTEKGHSETQATFILAISGVSDTIGRIAAGFILDFKKIRPLRPYVYNSVIFAVAIVSFLLPSLQAFHSYALMCAGYGLLTGAYISQKSVVVVDILGKENMSSSFGILILFQGVGTCVGPPLSGALKDKYDSNEVGFYVGGGCMVVAGCLMMWGNFLLRRKRKLKEFIKRERRRRASKHTISSSMSVTRMSRKSISGTLRYTPSTVTAVGYP